MSVVLLPEYSTFRRNTLAVFWVLASLSLARQRKVATSVSTLARLMGVRERSARAAVMSAYAEGLIDLAEVDGTSENYLAVLTDSAAESLTELCDAIEGKQPWLTMLK